MPNEPLPGVPLSSLTLSTSEVETAFHLPLSRMVQHALLRQDNLPNRPPYFAIDASDILGMEDGEKVEVWGLTGWYLNLFMRRLDFYDDP
jgi:hypothetical protein